MKEKPILGITMGDPAGIGPEIIIKVMERPRVREIGRSIVIGDASIMQKATRFVNSKMKIHAVKDVSEAQFEPGILDVYQLDDVDLADMKIGVVSPAAGHAAFSAVKTAIELAMAKKIDATVTAPIHKEALVKAGHHFPGHTEIYGHFTGTKDFTMMLAADKFRVVHVSTHVSLRQACDAVTKDRVLQVLRLAQSACKQLGIANPVIGVAGLNPHASDGGLFGTEEVEHIIPAIQAARAEGMTIEGPQAPDTFYAKSMSGIYDICVAMYHDQGHIPVKIKGFHFDLATRSWDSVNGINVSLGMPIIRTSVDHGTAFDQAGKGTASDASLLDAMEYAAKLAENR